MKTRTLLIILAILAGSGITGIGFAEQDSGRDHPEDQLTPAVTGTIRQEDHGGGSGSPTETPEVHATETPEVHGTKIQTQEQEHVAVVSRTQGTSDALREQLREQEQEIEQEHGTLTAGEHRVEERHVNETALVRVLQDESFTSTILGTGPAGIGPQFAEYARQWNESLQAQISAEGRIQARNPVVRFFLGGDRLAAASLIGASDRNQERIREMQQLILQCQACDPQVKSALQERLSQMQEEQANLRLQGEKEAGDTGLFGWIGR